MTQVRERADTAKQSATRMAEERKRTLADSVHALASAFDAAAASLTEGQQARLAEWTRELSGRTHRIASYLEEQDTGAMVTDLEGTARSHPTAFLGTSFAAGLAAGRFLRATQSSDTGAAREQGVDFEFHPDAALLADDRTEAASFGDSTTGYTSSGATGGYGNPGSGYGTTGSDVGHTRHGGPGDQGFGPTSTGATGSTGYQASGGIGTGGAAMASRAAGSTPIGRGTAGLNEGELLRDDTNEQRADNFGDEPSTTRRPTGDEGGI